MKPQAKYRISKARGSYWILEQWEEAEGDEIWVYVSTTDSKEEAKAFMQELINPIVYTYDAQGKEIKE